MSIESLYSKIQEKKPLVFIKGEDVLTNHGSEDLTLELKGSPPSYITTSNGVVAFFDGLNFVEIKNNVANRIADASTGHTIEALFHCNAVRIFARVFDIGLGNDSVGNRSDFFIVPTSSSVTGFDAYVGGHHVGYGVNYVGELTHYLATMTPSGVVKCYINGVYVGTTSGRNPNFALNDGNLLHSLNKYNSDSDQSGIGYFGYCVLHNRSLTEEEIQDHASEIDGLSFDVANTLIIDLRGAAISKPFTWANELTREEANPYPSKVQFFKKNKVSRLVAKTSGRKGFLNQDGSFRSLGYYQSTVLINNVTSANKVVLCFKNNGNLVDKTISDEQGIYRFDYLDLNKKYMFVAQYGNDANTPPDYTAVAADWQKPTPYGE